MSTLDSTSSDKVIHDAIADNASYLEDSSVAKARLFITAVTMWIMKAPKRTANSGEELELDLMVLADQLKEAKTFATQKAATANPGSSTQFADFRNFRG